MYHFEGERTGFCQVGPKKWIFPSPYMPYAEKYYNVPLREDDVWIVTYPRSGTTLCQEIIWLINNNLDYKTSKSVNLTQRFPFYEFQILHHDEVHKEIEVLNNNDPEVNEQLRKWRIPGYITLEQLPSPRHIKTHFSFSLLPPKLIDTCKVIYVARNPKDVAVSYYHHNLLFKVHGYLNKGGFKKYWEFFQKDLLTFSPYWEHIREGWEKRNEKNVLFLFYEDLIKDMSSGIKKIAKFLEKTIGIDDVNQLVNHLQIDNFRKSVPITYSVNGMARESAQPFIRQGKVGENKEFTDDILESADKWIEENANKIGIKFPVK
ncbi:hypothetical protein AAG570_000629 [Ranatra chinensis]|uniref:Sulfotransferase domain-containing protein n=1 Tax=Ranatra chinensis TaxID=642074 RepID=A0ABD0ZKX3_9HEMI